MSNTDQEERDLFHLEKLDGTNDWHDIIGLVSLMRSTNYDVLKRANDNIDRLTPKIPSIAYIHLDREIRKFMWYSFSYDAHLLAKNRRWHVISSPATVGFMTCSRDGYARQAAVESLNNVASGVEIPFLLIRLTDWVPQVARAAYVTLSKRIRKDYLKYLIPHLPLLERLRFRKRCDASFNSEEVLNRILDLIKSPDASTIVLELLDSISEIEAKKILFKCLTSTSGIYIDNPIKVQTVLDRGFAESDSGLRRLAIKSAANILPTETLLPMLRRGLRDKYFRIRCDCLELLCERKAVTLEELQQHALDRSPSPRALARHYLLKLFPDFDIISFYREKITETINQNSLAIIALCEVGTKSQIPELDNLLCDSNAKLRGAALSVLTRFHDPGDICHFLKSLSDPAQNVASVALKGLKQNISVIDTDDILNLFENSNRLSTLCKCIALFNRFEKWDRLGCLLSAASSDVKFVRERALVCIDSWVDRYCAGSWRYTMPYEKQAERVVLGFKKCAQYLRPNASNMLTKCVSELTTS